MFEGQKAHDEVDGNALCALVSDRAPPLPCRLGHAPNRGVAIGGAFSTLASCGFNAVTAGNDSKRLKTFRDMELTEQRSICDVRACRERERPRSDPSCCDHSQSSIGRVILPTKAGCGWSVASHSDCSVHFRARIGPPGHLRCPHCKTRRAQKK